MMPSIPDIPGYKIEKLIAEGGMASVYLARQESLSRPVALKLLRKFDNSSQALRFFNEGRIIASLEHRNIITIFDLGAVGGRHYLAMEFLQGGDLRSRINGGMTPLEVLELVETLGLCLNFVHRKGIIHRDIKPENILFRTDGSVVLTDFGVAKQMEFNHTLTMDGTTLGSPYYLSPEQATCKELDGRADIYSLGVVCYEMLTGEKPFQGDSPLETIMAHLTSNIPLLPPQLRYCQSLLARMIAPNPEDRFTSASEMAAFARDLRLSVPKRKLLKAAPPPPGADKPSPTLAQTLDQTLPHRIIDADAAPFPKSKKTPLKLAAGIGLMITLIPVLPFLRQAVSLKDIDEKPAQEQNITALPQAGATALPEPAGSDATRAAVTEQAAAVQPPAQDPLISTNLAVYDVNTALHQAAALLKEKQLTLPKLKQTYDLYQIALKMNPRQREALRGINVIAHQFIAIKGDIERYLEKADSALKSDQQDAQRENNAAGYYRQILALEPGHPEALQGLKILADRYADRVETHLRGADTAEAERILRLGLSLQADHPRLRSLAERLNVNIDADAIALPEP